jgi:hypothetical protein
MSAPDLARIPAVVQLAERGARFVLWKNVPDRKTGKPRKLPLRTDGKAADSTRPETWATFDEAVAAARRRRVDGVGFVFDGDGIGGVDLDGCRDPAAGEISTWAQEIVADFASYAEVSPSGTGVKIFAAGAPSALPANKISLGTAPAFRGEHAPQVEAYVAGRYFTITGRHLDGTPDEVVDATEAWERLAHRLRPAAEPAVAPAAEFDPAALPAVVARLLDAEPALRAAWGSGAKLTKGKDRSASGLDFSLVIWLAGRGWDDATIEAALRAYPPGQVGKLDEKAAARRIGNLLREAGKHRDRVARAREAAAWFEDLLVGKGGPLDCVANVGIALAADPAFRDVLRFDQLRGCPVAASLPWHPCEGWREWTDRDDVALAEWLQLRGLNAKPATCAAAVQHVAAAHPVDPLRERLEALAWDGTPRLDTWLTVYLGVADTAYARAVGRAWLVQAVARAFRPGCKADHALILEGPQGAFKSTACSILALSPDWFADEVADLGTKDSAQDLRGKWLVELGELSAMRRSAVERVKAFVSRSTDHYRPSYGRRSQDFPRRCVFVGTTNSDAYLADETGGRRFWPVRVGAIDIGALRRDAGQLWAEAAAAFRADEAWHLPRELELQAREQQAERRVTDPWEAAVLQWAGRQFGPVTIAEALTAIGLDLERRDQVAANRVARIFRAHGWERRQGRFGTTRVWHYWPPGASPVSPVGGGETGDGNAAETPAVTSVTGVTSKFQTSGANAEHGGRGHAPDARASPHESGDSPVTPVTLVTAGKTLGFPAPVPTGDGPATGDSPRWDDVDGWRARRRRARTREERVEVALAWGRAAGGAVTGTNGHARLTLPPLRSCLAAVELRQLAGDVGVLP